MSDAGEGPPWDEVAARGLVGRHVLVGLTYEGPSGGLIEQVQLHGEVERADPCHGIGIARAASGELFWLPPDLEAFEEAPAGEYRLRSTGEIVVDPDLIATWTVTAPDDDASPDWRQTLSAGFVPGRYPPEDDERGPG